MTVEATTEYVPAESGWAVPALIAVSLSPCPSTEKCANTPAGNPLDCSSRYPSADLAVVQPASPVASATSAPRASQERSLEIMSEFASPSAVAALHLSHPLKATTPNYRNGRILRPWAGSDEAYSSQAGPEGDLALAQRLRRASRNSEEGQRTFQEQLGPTLREGMVVRDQRLSDWPVIGASRVATPNPGSGLPRSR